MHGIWDKLRQLSRQLWIRMILISLLSFLAIGMAKLFGGIMPRSLTDIFGAKGLDRLLDLIANSMLTVTTFSVTIMVAVHFNAAANWTPRAHQVILQDKATQTVLATFLGAYLYAMLGIVLLETPYFGAREVVVLYLTTLIVLAIIVFTLGRWILRLQTFGSLADTAQRMETAALAEFAKLSRSPSHWAHPIVRGALPAGLRAVRVAQTGYIRSMDFVRLQKLAEEYGVDIWLTAPAGRFVAAGATVAHVICPQGKGADIEALDTEINSAITISEVRSMPQDPRFGLIQLAEIGSRALSPGVNDPGTAIGVVTRQVRILMSYDPTNPEDVAYDRLHLAPLDPEDLLADAFAPISRDADGQVEVHLAIIKSLAALLEYGPAVLRSAAARRGQLAYARAAKSLSFEEDLDRLKERTPSAFRTDAV